MQFDHLRRALTSTASDEKAAKSRAHSVNDV